MLSSIHHGGPLAPRTRHATPSRHVASPLATNASEPAPTVTAAQAAAATDVTAGMRLACEIESARRFAASTQIAADISSTSSALDAQQAVLARISSASITGVSASAALYPDDTTQRAVTVHSDKLSGVSQTAYLDSDVSSFENCMRLASAAEAVELVEGNCADQLPLVGPSSLAQQDPRSAYRSASQGASLSVHLDIYV